MSVVSLRQFDNSWYRPGRPRWQQVAWFFLGSPLLRSALLPFSGFRVWLLRCFGAEIGEGVVIKPGVQVKYPWHLRVGNYSWLGEDCWIDNLTTVTLGSDVCISQGAYLCTGNHDWSDPAFGLRIHPIRVDDGAWVGARVVLGPGARLEQGAVAAAGSVVTRCIPSWEVHSGNPAVFVRKRQMRTGRESTTAGEEAIEATRVRTEGVGQ